MSLNQYKKKRNFKVTAEPSGKKISSEDQLLFVVQQHAASHLHYDFRLEADGVLKSWAVPKGPSLNPDEKRLAMMVEDHPYEYKDFEGTIPEGNYGAGNVIVWDQGTYTSGSVKSVKEAEKKVLAGLKKGHISLTLKGKKLKGEFSLIKLKGKDDNAWLLVKKDDRYASENDILKKNKSVVSGKPLVIPVKDKKTLAKKKSATKSVKENKIKLPGQESVDCMLTKVKTEPFDSPEWIFETKFDGYRALAFVQPGQPAELYSRNHLSFTSKFAAISEALQDFNHYVVLDGEVVVDDKKGRSHFQLLQQYIKNGKGTLKYYVFDLLFLDGNDIRSMTLLERKALLKMLLEKEKPKNILYSDHVEDKGIKFYKSAVKNQLEGIIAKEKTSVYRSGKRTDDWVKIKINNEEEAVIAGITMPAGSRNHFGSLVLGMYRDGVLTYVGNCGTGFSNETLKSLYKKFEGKFTEKSPFDEVIKLREKIQWMKPHFVCQVKFTEWTSDLRLRHPVYLGLRTDKSAKEVVFPPSAGKK